MARVPFARRESLEPEAQRLYDRVGETRGSVINLYRVLFNSPGAAGPISALGEYIRYGSPLDPTAREIAILTTAQELGIAYEWAHHEPIAREVGVRAEVIDAIRSGRAPMGIPAKEGVFAQAAKELLRDGTLSAVTFQAVDHLIGPQQTIDLIVLVGYYTMLGGVLRALDVEMEEGGW